MNPILIEGVELLGRGKDRDSSLSMKPSGSLFIQSTSEFEAGTELIVLRPADGESIGELGSDRALYRSYSSLDPMAERIRGEI